MSRDKETMMQAYVEAEHIDSCNLAALLLVAVSAFVVILAGALEAPSFRLLAVIPAAASVRGFFIVVRWSRLFGVYRFEDADFVTARRKVTRSLWLWRAAILTQVLGVLVPL